MTRVKEWVFQPYGATRGMRSQVRDLGSGESVTDDMDVVSDSEPLTDLIPEDRPDYVGNTPIEPGEPTAAESDTFASLAIDDPSTGESTTLPELLSDVTLAVRDLVVNLQDQLGGDIITTENLEKQLSLAN